VGEVIYGENPATWPEQLRYEAIINRALASYPAWGVCLYDTRRLPAEVVAAAELTHPNLRTGDARAANPRYLDSAEFLRQLPDSGPDPLEATVPTLAVDDVRALRQLRQQLGAAVAGSALPAWTTGEFVFAVSEVATNAMRHGRPPVRVRAWVTSSRLLCTVTDSGGGIDDPFVGYAAAHRDPARGGLGLWLARRLCDDVDLRHTPEGFTVRLATGR
jgi:anti-sigma regulatory factor (Ser/Thr protein kinase)